MHRQGQDDTPSNPSGSMPVTDDQIREKYLERAIRELNTLTRELQSCPHCPRGNLMRSEEHTSELQSLQYLVCLLLLEKITTLSTDTRKVTLNPVSIILAHLPQ